MDKVTDGLKHDGGKPRLDLVPPEIIEAVGAVMTHGAEKYGEGSYRNVEPKRYRAALMRHICQWLRDPYGIDEDSGLPHIYHIACNVAFLLEIDKKQEGTNETEEAKEKATTALPHGWISVDERLPEEFEWVVLSSLSKLTGKRRFPRLSYMDDGHWSGCDYDERDSTATHWMPIPKNPSEEG